MKTIVFFGTYNPEYPRNRQMRTFFEQAGWVIITIAERGRGLGKYVRLYRKLLSLHGKYDAVWIGFPGALSACIARLVTRKKIYFDALVSWYDTMIDDRHAAKPKSIRAVLYYILDWITLRCAYRVIVDTEEHAGFFAQTFHLPASQFHVIYVSTDVKLFQPVDIDGSLTSKKYVVFWHGKYSPMHHVDIILDAAKKLLDSSVYEFRLLGSGQLFSAARERVSREHLINVRFFDTVPYEELPSAINSADVCLGVFGLSDKVDRVVPNKVYEYLACGKAVVTRDSHACRRILGNAEIYYTIPGDAGSLAQRIQESRLQKGNAYMSALNRKISVRLAENARESFLSLMSSGY